MWLYIEHWLSSYTVARSVSSHGPAGPYFPPGQALGAAFGLPIWPRIRGSAGPLALPNIRPGRQTTALLILRSRQWSLGGRGRVMC